MQKGGNGGRAESQSNQGQRGAAQNEGELVLAKLQFEGGFEDDENQPDRAEQFQHEFFKRNLVEPHHAQALTQADAHGDQHKHAWDVRAFGQQVGEVGKNHHGAAANHQAVGVDVVRGKLEVKHREQGGQVGHKGHARKIPQIRQ